MITPIYLDLGIDPESELMKRAIICADICDYAFQNAQLIFNECLVNPKNEYIVTSGPAIFLPKLFKDAFDDYENLPLVGRQAVQLQMLKDYYKI